MSLKELSAGFVFVGTVISGLLFLDSRHDPAGSRVEAEIYALDLTIADLTSTIARYNAQEESSVLTDANRVRREDLIRLRDYYMDERRDKQATISK